MNFDIIKYLINFY